MIAIYRVRHGGLMRCCLESLNNAMKVADVEPKEGDTHACQYCREKHGMIFRDGAWEWAAPKLWEQK